MTLRGASRRFPLVGLLFFAAPPVWGSEGAGAAHADPITQVVLLLAVILVAAKLGGEIAVRLGQPAVLGELVSGVLLGNAGLAGIHAFEAVATNSAIETLAGLGVLVLLFEVGLESTVRDMLRVGPSSLLVATLGVVAPFGLGWLVGAWLLPDAGPYVHAFLGATLTATSVGITARVLQDLERSRSAEARVILGAAVIDDVLGLVVLAVVSGAIAAAGSGGSLSGGAVGWIVGKAFLFLVGSLAIGTALSPKVFALGSRFRTRGVLLALGLSFCFILSWIAGLIGLAPIVGAFAAGLILEDVHYRDFKERGEHGIEELIHPISSFLVPVFFVVMGARTSLAAFANLEVFGLAAALTAAAVVGKQLCSAGVLGKGIDRLTVGLGMIPRGEVGLIFANVGLGLTVGGEPILKPATYSAIVVVVIVTTLVTPPALRWSIERHDRKRGVAATAAPPSP
jgi:Kef-type K+ transport system membrane component KefB